MSHLSSVKTTLCNVSLLERTLTTLKVEWYKENASHVIIPQANGNDFGFFWDGNEFEFIGDKQLWTLRYSIASFLEQIQHEYLFKSLLDDLHYIKIINSDQIYIFGLEEWAQILSNDC
jgi:hypothetical protein